MIDYEERYFTKPLFKKATFYANRVITSFDIYDNKELYKSGVVVEGSIWPPKEGLLLEIMFSSSLYGLYGSTSFIIKKCSEIRSGLAIIATREDSEENVECNFVLNDTMVN